MLGTVYSVHTQTPKVKTKTVPRPPSHSSVPNPPRKKKVADRPPVAPPNLSSYYEDSGELSGYANQAMDTTNNGDGGGGGGLRGGVSYSSGGGIIVPNGYNGHHDGIG